MQRNQKKEKSELRLILNNEGPPDLLRPAKTWRTLLGQNLRPSELHGSLLQGNVRRVLWRGLLSSWYQKRCPIASLVIIMSHQAESNNLHSSLQVLRFDCLLYLRRWLSRFPFLLQETLRQMQTWRVTDSQWWQLPTNRTRTDAVIWSR